LRTERGCGSYLQAPRSSYHVITIILFLDENALEPNRQRAMDAIPR